MLNFLGNSNYKNGFLMNISDYEKLYEKDKGHYLLKICEEFAELQQALLHWHEGKLEPQEVFKEYVDVLLQLLKIKYILIGFDGELDSEFNEKTNDLFNQIESNLHRYLTKD